jgi:hypothetical protein
MQTVITSAAATAIATATTTTTTTTTILPLKCVARKIFMCLLNTV